MGVGQGKARRNMGWKTDGAEGGSAHGVGVGWCKGRVGGQHGKVWRHCGSRRDRQMPEPPGRSSEPGGSP